MYYDESARIASNYPEFTDDIMKIDEFLKKRDTVEFYLGDAADILGIGFHRLNAIIQLYEGYKVVAFREVWICPEDGQEIEIYAADTLHCELCDGHYHIDECQQKILVQPKKSPRSIQSNAGDEQSQTVKDTETTQNNDRASDEKSMWKNPTIIAAIITVVGGIIIAVVAGFFTLYEGDCTNPATDNVLCEISAFWREAPTLTPTLILTPQNEETPEVTIEPTLDEEIPEVTVEPSSNE